MKLYNMSFVKTLANIQKQYEEYQTKLNDIQTNYMDKIAAAQSKLEEIQNNANKSAQEIERQTLKITKYIEELQESLRKKLNFYKGELDFWLSENTKKIERGIKDSALEALGHQIVNESDIPEGAIIIEAPEITTSLSKSSGDLEENTQLESYSTSSSNDTKNEEDNNKETLDTSDEPTVDCKDVEPNQHARYIKIQIPTPVTQAPMYQYTPCDTIVGTTRGNDLPKRRRTTEIIIHCAATPEGKEFSVEDITKWHIQDRGFSTIGYHYVIHLDGSIEKGREESKVGAHCEGHNSRAVGISYIGGVKKNGKTPKDTRTPAQKRAIRQLVATLRKKYPNATVHGHYEFSDKACPSFNVKTDL